MPICALSLLSIILLLLAGGKGHAQQVQPTPYQLKAAFLYRFAQFIDWPAASFAEENSPFVIGVVGDNPFGMDLQQTLQGKTLNNHVFLVKEVPSQTAATNCHMLFISSSEKKRMTQIVTGLGQASTLTVGEMDHFIEAGGMINFFQEGTKIRFEISEASVKQAGLKISSKLLSLASHPAH